jgi:hypothetical protein
MQIDAQVKSRGCARRWFMQVTKSSTGLTLKRVATLLFYLQQTSAAASSVLDSRELTCIVYRRLKRQFVEPHNGKLTHSTVSLTCCVWKSENGVLSIWITLQDRVCLYMEVCTSTTLRPCRHGTLRKWFIKVVVQLGIEMWTLHLRNVATWHKMFHSATTEKTYTYVHADVKQILFQTQL